MRKIQQTKSADKSTTSTDPVAGKTVAEILGEIVWLMTQDTVGRKMKISEIERLVMPAILQRRFHIKYAQVPDVRRMETVTLQPMSVEILSLGTSDKLREHIVFGVPFSGNGVPK